jgi:hypothetical protein
MQDGSVLFSCKQNVWLGLLNSCRYDMSLQQLLSWLLTCCACFALSLTTCQVHQVELAHANVAGAVCLCRTQHAAATYTPAAGA